MEAVDFIKQFPLRTFAKGELVMSEGDVLNKLLAVKTGFIKVTSLDDTGNERMLWIAGRYDIVPSEHLFSTRSPLSFFYTALTDGQGYDINKNEFLSYSKSNLALMTDVATSMSAHYDDLLLRVDSIGQPSVHNKLIATLSYLAKRFSASHTVDLHKLGLSTRETTSLELQKLRREGCIDYSRSKFIIRLDKITSSVVS